MTGVKFDRPSWIARLLDFQRDGDVFVAPQPSGGPGKRLFGGLIAAQSLAAAGGTVEPDKLPQSLHLYFVRGGEYGVDVELNVVRTRDGRSFDTRQVTAVQHGKTILEMIASFHRPEQGADWHPTPPPGIDFDAPSRRSPTWASRAASRYARPPATIRRSWCPRSGSGPGTRSRTTRSSVPAR
jgi:acyl-CoA thioesterase-2